MSKKHAKQDGEATSIHGSGPCEGSRGQENSHGNVSDAVRGLRKEADSAKKETLSIAERIALQHLMKEKNEAEARLKMLFTSIAEDHGLDPKKDYQVNPDDGTITLME